MKESLRIHLCINVYDIAYLEPAPKKMGAGSRSWLPRLAPAPAPAPKKWPGSRLRLPAPAPAPHHWFLEYSLNQKKAVCISSYYDKLPMCEISKPNESPSQRYPCDRRTNGRTDECEFIGHRFVKPVTNKKKLRHSITFTA